MSHVQLTVRDLSVSEPWYSELFGLTRLGPGSVQDGRGHVALRHRPSKLVLVLSTAADGREGDDRFDEHRVGLNHLAFAVPTADALDEWLARCGELGVDHDPVIVDAAGGRSLILRDPDGIQLELFVAPTRR